MRRKKHRICIFIPEDSLLGYSLTDTLQDIMKEQFLISFISDRVYIRGIRYDFMSAQFEIYLSHPYFPEQREGEVCERFSMEMAKQKFPWLFYPTNPLLYKKFPSNIPLYKKKNAVFEEGSEFLNGFLRRIS